jgi:hypothetical protein
VVPRTPLRHSCVRGHSILSIASCKSIKSASRPQQTECLTPPARCCCSQAVPPCAWRQCAPVSTLGCHHAHQSALASSHSPFAGVWRSERWVGGSRPEGCGSPQFLPHAEATGCCCPLKDDTHINTTHSCKPCTTRLLNGDKPYVARLVLLLPYLLYGLVFTVLTAPSNVEGS